MSVVRALKMPVAFSIPAYAPERARPAQLGSAYFGTRAAALTRNAPPACRMASSVFAVQKNGETNLHHVAHGKRNVAGGFHDGMRHGFEFAFRHVGVRAAHAYGGDGVA